MDLPGDLWYIVASFLPFEALIPLRHLNRTFYEIVCGKHYNKVKVGGDKNRTRQLLEDIGYVSLTPGYLLVSK